MSHAGRPRRYTELEELRKRSKADRERLAQKFGELRKELTAFDLAWAAATILHTLEKQGLSAALNADCQDRIAWLRKTTTFAYAVDPHGRMRDHEFLEAFIEKCEPGWDWRKQSLNKAQIEDKEAREKRYIQELAQTQRESMAHANRHLLPYRPDPSRLKFLTRRIIPNESMTWPTLKDLKLATALSERTIRQVINQSRPKKSELVQKTPRRFGPRLVVAVIEGFLGRLPSLEIDEEKRNDCIAAGRQCKRHLRLSS